MCNIPPETDDDDRTVALLSAYIAAEIGTAHLHRIERELSSSYSKYSFGAIALESISAEKPPSCICQEIL